MSMRNLSGPSFSRSSSFLLLPFHLLLFAPSLQLVTGSVRCEREREGERERDWKLNPQLQQQRMTKHHLFRHISPHMVSFCCLSAKAVELIGDSHPSEGEDAPGDSWLWIDQWRNEKRAEYQLDMERRGNHHNLACVSSN